jgi:hypothetical protein
MDKYWKAWGLYNAVLMRRGQEVDGVVHVGMVDNEGDPIRPMCKCSRSTKFMPICGHVPLKRFCKKCLQVTREDGW